MPRHLAHHFDDPAQQYEAATLGMWAFLATEVLFFGGLFAGYAVYRSNYPAAFAEGSRHLDLWMGTINTVVLLLSSLTMALALYAAQTDRRRETFHYLAATLGLGLVFLGIKAYEYGHKVHEHLVPGSLFHPKTELRRTLREAGIELGNFELFFSFYIAMTGMHALHMVIGVGILAVLMVMSWQGRFSAIYYTPVEISGLYWHFVDIVWVFLYPLLYLIAPP